MRARQIDFDDHLKILEEYGGGNVSFLSLRDNFNRFAHSMVQAIIGNDFDVTLIVIEEHPRKARDAEKKLKRLGRYYENLPAPGKKNHEIHGVLLPTAAFNQIKHDFYNMPEKKHED